ncbi:hypothetical protein BDQ12DRAFT_574814, partial [Crucibulum laeve]
LSDNELEKHEQEMDAYATKQAQVREIIYETVSKSTFLDIKNEPSAAAMWIKLVSINEKKSDMFETDV